MTLAVNPALLEMLKPTSISSSSVTISDSDLVGKVDGDVVGETVGPCDAVGTLVVDNVGLVDVVVGLVVGDAVTYVGVSVGAVGDFVGATVGVVVIAVGDCV